ncbi:MAG: DNRLRE domain-containing protein, partial [Lachnoclostridium sp.]|nr:DNRLRE domain-containing protein [Lachnoclostridium sp.]
MKKKILRKKHLFRIIAVTLILVFSVQSVVYNGLTTNAEKSKEVESNLKNDMTPDSDKKTGTDDSVDLGSGNEIQKKRTLDSTFYEESDGAKTVLYHGGKVRFIDSETKKIVDYDPTLVEAEDQETVQKTNLDGYRFKSKASDKINYFPEVLEADTPLLSEYLNYQIGLVPSEPGLPAVSDGIVSDTTISDVTVSGSAITTNQEKSEAVFVSEAKEEVISDLYGNEKEAITGVSYDSKQGIRYSYQSYAEGLHSSILLEEIPENNTFSYDFQLKNSYAKIWEADSIKEKDKDKPQELMQGKEIEIYNETGNRIGQMPAVFYHDASEKVIDKNGTYYLEQISEVKEGEDVHRSYRLTIEVEEEYLHHKDRIYPIQIDSSVTWDSADDSMIQDTYVRNGNIYKNTNYNKMDTIGAGSYEKDRMYGYLKFENIEKEFAGKYIGSAVLSVTEARNSEEDTVINIGRTKKDWDEKTITYQNRPNVNEKPLNSYIASGVRGTKGMLDLTDYMIGLVQGHDANYGLEISGEEKGNNKDSGAVWLYSTDHIQAEYRPSLKITYYD